MFANGLKVAALVSASALSLMAQQHIHDVKKIYVQNDTAQSPNDDLWRMIRGKVVSHIVAAGGARDGSKYYGITVVDDPDEADAELRMVLNAECTGNVCRISGTVHLVGQKDSAILWADDIRVVKHRNASSAFADKVAENLLKAMVQQ
jgi:hypothetical protein